jgi:peptide/nickel transport system substrate-binding protein
MSNSSLPTRRTAITGALAVGLGSGGLVGCSPHDGAGAHAALASQAGPVGPPRRGGRIRVASVSSSSADTLDPAKGAINTDYVRHYMIYSGLTQFDSNLSPRLGLAETIESGDRKVWRIKLRKGVQFHDGSTLTSADVVYSLLRHKDPATASKVKSVADQIQTANAVGRYEVEVRLEQPNADLPAILATSHFLIVRNGARDFRSANGCGPYRCRVFNPGVRTIGVRNENYWKPGRPYLDEIELIGIPDEVSRVNALLTGDVHLINAVNARSIRRIERSARHRVLETKSGLYTDLIMRQDRAPTSSPDFTAAMKSLVDRELIRKALFRGRATLANDHPIAPSNPYYLPGLPQRAYDPDRAKFLLKRAGLLNVRLPVYASPAAEGSVDMASILQESAAGIGLQLTIDRVPADGYWSTHWMRHPLTFGNINPRPTADLLFSLFFKSDAVWNESGWKNDQFDQLLFAARGEADEAKRKQMYGDMQVLVHQAGGVGVPVFISLLDAYDRRLEGFGAIPIGGLMGYSFAEYVWWAG